MSRPLRTTAAQQTILPAWSPDGSKVAFTSDSDGDGLFEIWIANRDGSNPRRLTQKSGGTDEGADVVARRRQIAFTSDRVGRAADLRHQRRRHRAAAHHLRRQAMRPADLVARYDAPRRYVFAQRTSSIGNDIMLFDFATRETRQLTNGEGNNESPCFAPNGRHVLFTTTRWGKAQLADHQHRRRRREAATRCRATTRFRTGVICRSRVKRHVHDSCPFLACVALIGLWHRSPPPAAGRSRPSPIRPPRPRRRPARPRATPMAPPAPPTPAARAALGADGAARRPSDLDAQPTRRHQQGAAAQAGVLRVRQRHAGRRGAAGADGRRRRSSRQYATWAVTIEGHCDERGTAEYNLALGERRALAAKNYLVSLGIAADRLQDRQLRQGISVRPRPRRKRVVARTGARTSW